MLVAAEVCWCLQLAAAASNGTGKGPGLLAFFFFFFHGPKRCCLLEEMRIKKTSG